MTQNLARIITILTSKHHLQPKVSNDMIISDYECKIKFIALERITIMECAVLASASQAETYLHCHGLFL